MIKGFFKFSLPLLLLGSGCALIVMHRYPMGIPLIFLSGCLCVLLLLQYVDLKFEEQGKAPSFDSEDSVMRTSVEAQLEDEAELSSPSSASENKAGSMLSGAADFRLDKDGWLVHERPERRHQSVKPILEDESEH